MCGYELPTNLQNFTQKDLTEVKIFQNVLGGYFFLKHPVYAELHCSSVWTICGKWRFTNVLYCII